MRRQKPTVRSVTAVDTEAYYQLVTCCRHSSLDTFLRLLASVRRKVPQHFLNDMNRIVTVKTKCELCLAEQFLDNKPVFETNPVLYVTNKK